MKTKRQKPTPPSDEAIKHAYKLYLSKEFTLQQISRHTKVSPYWIYKHHNKKIQQAEQLQTKLFDNYDNSI
jgi:DNA invertase Pin-like site-specific DNA recombinase